MYDKAKLGQRYTCFSCGTKFYDLNRPIPICPECGDDQRNAPVKDISSLLSSRRRGRAAAAAEPKEAVPAAPAADEDEDEDDFGLTSDENDSEAEA
jgi:hypothetical protein